MASNVPLKPLTSEIGAITMVGIRTWTGKLRFDTGIGRYVGRTSLPGRRETTGHKWLRANAVQIFKTKGVTSFETV